MNNEKNGYQTVLSLLQELIEAGKETDRRMKDTDQRIKVVENQIADTNKNIDKLNDLVGCLAAEEEFFNQNFNIYGAIAGKILSNKTIEEAKKYNLFVVAQEANELRLINIPM